MNVLGIAFASILGVTLTEYYLLNPNKKAKAKTPKIDPTGLASWLIGALVVYASSEMYEIGIACLNGLVVSGVVYFVLKQLANEE